jgi:hypothetical protein
VLCAAFLEEKLRWRILPGPGPQEKCGHLFRGCIVSGGGKWCIYPDFAQVECQERVPSFAGQKKFGKFEKEREFQRNSASN